MKNLEYRFCFKKSFGYKKDGWLFRKNILVKKLQLPCEPHNFDEFLTINKLNFKSTHCSRLISSLCYDRWWSKIYKILHFSKCKIFSLVCFSNCVWCDSLFECNIIMPWIPILSNFWFLHVFYIIYWIILFFVLLAQITLSILVHVFVCNFRNIFFDISVRKNRSLQNPLINCFITCGKT